VLSSRPAAIAFAGGLLPARHSTPVMRCRNSVNPGLWRPSV